MVAAAAALTLAWLAGPTMVLGRSTAQPEAAPYEADHAKATSPVTPPEPPGSPADTGRSSEATQIEPTERVPQIPRQAPKTSRRRTQTLPSRPDPLLAEMRLIEQAEALLRQNRPAPALELLSEHERSFAQGELAVERQALRVIALCSLGKHAQGRGEAAVLKRRGLSAPYEERIDRACRENRDDP